MTAGFTCMQAGLAIIAVAALALFGPAPFALGLSAAIVVWGASMSLVYWFSRRALRPPLRDGDVPVAIAWLLAGLVTGALGLEHAALVVDSPSTLAFALTVGPLAVLLVIMLASSLADWYYVVPRISGLVRTPPCCGGGKPVWLRLTGLWYTHRWVTAFAVIAGLSIALGGGVGTAFYLLIKAALSTWKVGTAKEVVAALIATIGSIIVVVLGWLKAFAAWFPGSYLESVRRASLPALNPPYAVGRYIKIRIGDHAPLTGYVLDIAIEGMKLIPASEITKATQSRRSPEWTTIRTRDLVDASIMPAEGNHCTAARCLYINEKYCLRAQRLAAERDATAHRAV